jgi:hypothetical protein
VREKLVAPLAAPLVSAGETVIATPLAGLVEFTVSTYVVTGGIVVLMLPPQAVKNRLSPSPAAANHRKFFIPMLPVRPDLRPPPTLLRK